MGCATSILLYLPCPRKEVYTPPCNTLLMAFSNPVLIQFFVALRTKLAMYMLVIHPWWLFYLEKKHAGWRWREAQKQHWGKCFIFAHRHFSALNAPLTAFPIEEGYKSTTTELKACKWKREKAVCLNDERGNSKHFSPDSCCLPNQWSLNSYGGPFATNNKIWETFRSESLMLEYLP